MSETLIALRAATHSRESSVATKHLALVSMIERLRVRPHTDEGACRLQACEAQLDVVQRELSRLWYSYIAFDFIWSAFHAIRHELCFLLDWDELSQVVDDIRSDLPYLRDERDRREQEVIVGELERRLAGARDAEHPVIRQALCALSERVGSLRDAHWRKVNRLRTRLRDTAILIVVALGVCAAMTPHYVEAPILHPVDKARVSLSGAQTAAVLAFGALGGLTSALRVREAWGQPSALYQIERITLYVRPIVGAVSALLLTLAYAANILDVLPSNTTGIVPLMIAFIGGFSERFFLDNINSLAAAWSPKAGGDTPEPRTPAALGRLTAHGHG
jgi:hypothetical protein